MDTKSWVGFFRKAGLPPVVSANYALIFTDNRIQLDMLLDLSKEYLFDMGIKIMGDVIAILKYAKEFSNQLAKERIIGPYDVPTPGAQKKAANPVAQRMMGHYTQASRLSPARLPAPQLQRSAARAPTVISLKRKPVGAGQAVSPPKKPRRVPPEEEGGYNIKMPSGTTEKTRRILQRQSAGGAVKHSVFSRLGESSVSSTTDFKKTSSSVFNRLGDVQSSGDLPTSTVNLARRKGPQLPYQGVLKRNVLGAFIEAPKRVVMAPAVATASRNVGINRINAILCDVESPLRRTVNTRNQITIGIKDRIGAQSDVKSRLGIKTTTGVANRLGIQPNQGVKNRLGTANSVQNRLGMRKGMQGRTQTGSVFDRLGD